MKMKIMKNMINIFRRDFFFDFTNVLLLPVVRLAWGASTENICFLLILQNFYVIPTTVKVLVLSLSCRASPDLIDIYSSFLIFRYIFEIADFEYLYLKKSLRYRQGTRAILSATIKTPGLKSPHSSREIQ